MRSETQESKLTKSQAQDDDTELYSQQEETSDFPQHLKRQQTLGEAPVGEEISCVFFTHVDPT